MSQSRWFIYRLLSKVSLHENISFISSLFRVKSFEINFNNLDLQNEIKECNNWSLKLKDIVLKTDTKDEYLKTLAFARIICIYLVLN